jgi:hypothetical protein
MNHVPSPRGMLKAMFYALETRTQHKKKLKPGVKKMTRTTTIIMAVLTALSCSTAMAAKKPLKVYILAGQSNMEGHAHIRTFDYIGDDPATAPMLKEMRGPDGKPTVCEKVWISYLTGGGENLGEGSGKLTAGYGSRSDPEKKAAAISARSSPLAYTRPRRTMARS